MRKNKHARPFRQVRAEASRGRPSRSCSPGTHAIHAMQRRQSMQIEHGTGEGKDRSSRITRARPATRRGTPSWKRPAQPNPAEQSVPPRAGGFSAAIPPPTGAPTPLDPLARAASCCPWLRGHRPRRAQAPSNRRWPPHVSARRHLARYVALSRPALGHPCLAVLEYGPTCLGRQLGVLAGAHVTVRRDRPRPGRGGRVEPSWRGDRWSH